VTIAPDNFRECITHTDIGGMLPSRGVEVVKAHGAEEGDDWDGWAGGFVILMADGRYAYCEGWCDYTGWG